MGEEVYRSVSLPKSMVDEAEVLAKHPKLKHLGFSSHSDLIRKALASRLVTLRTTLAHINAEEERRK
jgi:hypothetical protein